MEFVALLAGVFGVIAWLRLDVRYLRKRSEAWEQLARARRWDELRRRVEADVNTWRPFVRLAQRDGGGDVVAAGQLYQLGAYEETLQLVDRAIARSRATPKTHAIAVGLRVITLAALRRYDEARAAGALLLRLPGATPSNRSMAATAELSCARYESALRIAEALISEDAGCTLARVAASMALVHLGRPREALSVLDHVPTGAPTFRVQPGLLHDEIVEMKKQGEARHAAVVEPAKYTQAAWVFLTLDEGTGALAMLEQCAPMMGQHPLIDLTFHRYSAHANALAGRREPALDELGKMWAIAESHPSQRVRGEAQLSTGVTLLYLGDLEGARSALDAIEGDRLHPPDRAMVQHWRGRLAEAAGRTEQAITLYGKLLDEGPPGLARRRTLARLEGLRMEA